MAKERKFQSLTQLLYAAGEKIRFAPDAEFAPARSETAQEKSGTGRSFLSYRLRIKSSLAKMCEQSLFLNMLSGFYRALFSVRMRSFGVLFFSCGFLQILSYFLGSYIPFLGGNEKNFLFGVCLVFLAILCSFTRGDVKEALKKSLLFRIILAPIFGVKAWQFPSGRSHDRFMTMTALGVVFAFFSIIFSPISVLCVVFFVAMVLFMFYLPEAGLLFMGFGALFLPFSTVSLMTFLTLISFLFKCAIGKRSLVFSLSDAVVFLGLLPVAFASFDGAFLQFFTLFVLYYMVRCFLNSLQWIRRFLVCVVAGGAFSALLLTAGCVLEMFFPTLMQRFSHAKEIFLLTVDPSYGALFVILCPFALGVVHSLKNKGRKFIFSLVLPILFCAVFFFKEFYLWNVLFVSFVVYFLFTYRTSFIWISSFALILISVKNILPMHLLQRILSPLGFGEKILLEEKIGVLSYLKEAFGAFLIPSLVLFALCFLVQVVMVRKFITKQEVFPQVLGFSCAMIAFFAVVILNLAANEEILVFLAYLMALPSAAFRCAKREEQRLPY